MNLLRTIIERLNQRVEVANIFDKQFGLCELNANGNDKAWVHYIGNGQAEVVTNFDAKQGTLFWAKRGKVTVNKTEAYKMSGCKQLYVTSFPLTAYAVVRKSHLPCDSEDAQDWLASRVYKLTSGTDPLFKQSIAVINYEVIPTGYTNEIKTLTAHYEWACVSIDFDVQVITTTEDGCYDICATGDIPLPDLPACTPCLTEVAVDGVTIIGNGTAEDPLVAIGGSGSAIAVQDEGIEITPVATTLNFTGDGVTASLTSPGMVEVNIPGGSSTPQVNSDWNATSGVAEILNKPTIPTATSELTNDSGFITSADIPPQVNADWSSTSGVSEILNKPIIPTLTSDLTNDSGFITSADVPTLTSELTNDSGFITSADVPTLTSELTNDSGFITIADVPTQVNSDWNATSGLAEILNKPTIPAAQIQSDWTQSNNAALDYIKNKPTLTNGTVTSIATTGLISGGTITTSGTISTSMATNKLVGRYSASNGVMEEITIGSGLTLTGAGVLNNTAAATPLGYYGAWQDNITQTAALSNVGYPLIYRTVDLENQVRVVTNGSQLTRITFDNTGIYNLQFSVQIQNTDNAQHDVTIWIRKNGVDVTGSAGFISVPARKSAGAGNEGHGVYGWNYLLSVVAGEYYEIVWSTSNAANVTIQYYSAGSPPPSTASVIATVTQQSGIMSGTGITAINSLTGAAQTLAVGTSGTNFAISSSGSTHTFNLPTASASNRGALSSADWSTFNGKQAALGYTPVTDARTITINGTTQDLTANRSWTIPTMGIYKNTTDGAASSGTANTFSQSVLVPANSVVLGSVIEFKLRGKKTGANQVYTIRLYANTTNNLSGTPILLATYTGGAVQAISMQLVRTGAVKNVTTNTEMLTGSTNLATDFANVGFSAIAVDWTTNQYIIGAVQNNSALDSSIITLISMTII